MKSNERCFSSDYEILEVSSDEEQPDDNDDDDEVTPPGFKRKKVQAQKEYSPLAALFPTGIFLSVMHVGKILVYRVNQEGRLSVLCGYM